MTADEAVKQFNVYLPHSLVRAVKVHAALSEQSLSRLTESALREYLANHEEESS